MPVPTAVPPMVISRSQSDAWASFWRWRWTVWPYAANSWPRRMGVASCRWVRPDLMTSSNSVPLARNAVASTSRAASVEGSVASIARRIAVGMTSLVLCAMLT